MSEEDRVEELHIEELPPVEFKPRGGKKHDFNKIRILHILENHVNGCKQIRLRYLPPPGTSENPDYLDSVLDLIDDGLVTRHHDDEDGIPIITITNEGREFLQNIRELRNTYSRRFHIFRILDEDTRFPRERRQTQFVE